MSQVNYYKMVLEGSHYELGKKKGEFIKSVPELVAIYIRKAEKIEADRKEKVARQVAYLKQYCPGIDEELQGVADGLGVSLEQLNPACFGDELQVKPCACSEVLVLPMKTADGHCYMGRSYEYNLQDEFQFNITRAKGSYAHMGFSLFLGGRFDGMNEKGLCIAMSSCECVESSAGKAEGIPFYYMIRAILDTCATTEEAIHKLEETPMRYNGNLMIVDQFGEFVVAEVLTYDGKSHVAYRSEVPYTYALNHYQTKEQREKAPVLKNFSKMRADAIDAFMKKNKKVSKKQLMDLLSTKLPEGLCCHAYRDIFGTLRSMIFDVTDQKLSICLGSPDEQSYMEVSLREQEGIETYDVTLNNEKVPISYWKNVCMENV